MRIGIFLGPFLGHTEDFLRIVLPDLIIGDDRYANSLEHGLLIPGLADAVAIDGSRFQRGRHLRRWRHRQQYIRLDLTRRIAFGRGIVPGVNSAGGQPVAQLVVVRGNGENHAHVEGLAFRTILLNHWLERIGLDRMHRLTVLHRNVLLHFLPDRIRHGDAVAVEVHTECRDHIGLRAEPDRCG